MEALNEILPIIIYTLSAILLVTVIILVLKLIKTVDKTNTILDDIEEKSRSLDGLFYTIDTITDSIASINDKLVDTIVSFIGKLFHKKKKREESEEEYE